MTAALASVVGCASDAPDAATGVCDVGGVAPSAARYWNEAALDAIRIDFPAPTVHARNLYHLSAAMWDVWRAAAPEDRAGAALFVDGRPERAEAGLAPDDAMSFAAFRLLDTRYRLGLAGPATTELLVERLDAVCGVEDPARFVAERPESSAAFGWELAGEIIEQTRDDGSLERRAYEDLDYQPVNPPLMVDQAGTDLVDVDRWQPLLLRVARSQNGLPLPGGEQTFVGSNWGAVERFAQLDADALADLDPGGPPLLTDAATREQLLDELVEVIRASSELEVGVSTLDIRPDPSLPENVVDAADYYRVIAEHWADGPTSETPPGHWNTIANRVSDRSAELGLELRVGGDGPVVDRLEWDVKLGVMLNGALHDAAIAAWGFKASYDSIRPISLIRWLGPGDRTLDDGTPVALPEVPGLIEVITESSAAPGERHEHLAEFVGETAVRAWIGSPNDPDVEVSGVGWIRAAEWVPYQRPTFVTPAFAGYVSGHSTFSRAGAEALAAFTGDTRFPGGLYEYTVPAGTLLHEDGPSADLTLQWVEYVDAADEAGSSRIWGGIHIRADDLDGREVGAKVGVAAAERAFAVFAG